jgi:hypothetical protein
MSARVNESAPRVKNRAAAAIQITAEQLLREVRMSESIIQRDIEIVTCRLKNDKKFNSALLNSALRILRSFMNIGGGSGKSSRSGSVALEAR